jgi:hypothetical protein
MRALQPGCFLHPLPVMKNFKNLSCSISCLKIRLNPYNYLKTPVFGENYSDPGGFANNFVTGTMGKTVPVESCDYGQRNP